MGHDGLLAAFLARGQGVGAVDAQPVVIHGLEQHPVLEPQKGEVVRLGVGFAVRPLRVQLDQRLDVAHARFRVRVGEQVLGHLAAHAVAGDAAHGAQHLLHARRVALHLLHPAETEPVGLLLVLTAVLQVDRLTGGHGADQEPLGERRHAQGQTGDAGQDRHRADLGTLVEPLGDVPADHVADLVGEHAEQLVLGAHGLDQA